MRTEKTKLLGLIGLIFHKNELEPLRLELINVHPEERVLTLGITKHTELLWSIGDHNHALGT